jgi:arylsulfatase A-like enzyme
MRSSAIGVVIAIAAWAALAVGACAAPEADRPNFVYILADDLGFGDVGAYNPDSRIPTPHIDQLSAEGIRFTDAHSPASVCTPTRYALLTGRYSWRSPLSSGVLWSYGRSLIEPDRPTLASVLREQAYTTAVIGKWHLGLDWQLHEPLEGVIDTDRVETNENGWVMNMDHDLIDFARPVEGGPVTAGFDHSFILPSSLDIPPYGFFENNSLVAPMSDYTEGNDLDTGFTGAFWRPGPMMEGFDFYRVLPTFAEKAIGFLESQAERDAPFFLYLPLSAPHTPWVPTDAYDGRSQAGAYGDFVSMVDDAVGQVLDALDRFGLRENTVVVFTSDNGPFWGPASIERFGHRAAGPLRGQKADIWEGGHRVPFIVRWPGRVAAGSTSDVTTTLTNWMATSADILGVSLSPDAGEDSVSILPALLGEAPPADGPVVHHSMEGMFAVRHGPWKFVEGRGSGGFSEPVRYEPEPGEPVGQLYNLGEDPGEAVNLYADRPEIVDRLMGTLEAIR